MKLKKIQAILLLLMSLSVMLSSCGEDRWAGYAGVTAKDRWIYEVMQDNYLWYDELPSEKNLNFFSAPSTFLSSIIYKASDNSYSFADTVMTTPLPSYGMDYTLQRNAASDTAYYALVSRVYPDSPASDAGLKRGDWIMYVDGTVITRKNETALLASGDAVSLTIGSYVTDTDSLGVTTSSVRRSGTVSLAAARPVEDEVVGTYSVITTATGVKLGYLVYNRFEDGTEAEPEKYNDELRNISRYFASQGVTHLAIDMRYNSGGSFLCSQLLASLVAPVDAVTSSATYAQMTYNDKRSADNSTLRYSTAKIGDGANLNIYQGFVITGSGTSASICGTFLNCLSTFGNWALVGSSVACWGAATERFISTETNWAVNPIVCTVSNSDGVTGAGGSFTPNVSLSETSDLSRYLPLGNPEEALLHAVIQLIDSI
jgi:hypothetical protein